MFVRSADSKYSPPVSENCVKSQSKLGIRVEMRTKVVKKARVLQRAERPKSVKSTEIGLAWTQLRTHEKLILTFLCLEILVRRKYKFKWMNSQSKYYPS